MILFIGLYRFKHAIYNDKDMVCIDLTRLNVTGTGTYGLIGSLNGLMVRMLAVE